MGHLWIDVFGGVIDADYVGEIGVILYNSKSVDYQITAGDWIATPEITEVGSLTNTQRGNGGFGSAGQ